MSSNGIHYYTHPSVKYPEIVESIVERINIYFASTMYKKDYRIDPQKAFSKIFISDAEAGEGVNLTDAIQVFESNLNILPFTVYNITDIRKADEGLTPYGELGILFDPDLDAKILVYPMFIELQYISFFNSALDFFTSLTALNSSKMLNSMLYVPIEVNGKEKNVPIRIKYETTKGGLVSKFQDYLAQNKVYNHITVCTIFYYEYQVTPSSPPAGDDDFENPNGSGSGQNGSGTSGEEGSLRIRKVDNMIARLGKIRSDGRLLTSEQTSISQEKLNVISKSITLGVTADLVVITFNQSVEDFNNSQMKNKIFIKQGVISPLWSYSFNNDYTILNINIFGRDVSQKTIITLSKKISSTESNSMDNDYEIIIP